MAYREAGGEPREIDPALFREEFDIMCLQRNMKAAGRFVFIDKVKGNPKFLQYIPRTLDNIRRNLERYPAFEALQAALGESVPALRPR
jgi:aminoglycoside/choline kinase family phosphotransferase